METQARLERELHQAHMQLSDCLAAALGCCHGSRLRQRGDYGWSPAYAEVVLLRLAFEFLAKGETFRSVLARAKASRKRQRKEILR